MSSEIKVSSVKSKTGSDAITIADDGHIQNAITLDGGIANAGTISAGTLGSSVVFPAGGTGNAISVAVIADQKGSTEHGGASTSSYTDRELNTELSDPDSIVTISSDQFTLVPGTYLINWSAPACKTNEQKTQLYDVTAGSTLKEGTSEYSGTSNTSTARSEGSFVHTITSNNTYSIKHRVQNTQSTFGYGIYANYDGQNNIYTLVVIQKLK